MHAAWPFTFVARSEGTSYEELGRHFGGRDHTTILHAFQRAARQVETDLETCHTVRGLTERLLAAAAGL